jgi:hypothetical protein
MNKFKNSSPNLVSAVTEPEEQEISLEKRISQKKINNRTMNKFKNLGGRKGRQFPWKNAFPRRFLSLKVFGILRLIIPQPQIINL